jgi:hypothetical protein
MAYNFFFNIERINVMYFLIKIYVCLSKLSILCSSILLCVVLFYKQLQAMKRTRTQIFDMIETLILVINNNLKKLKI